MLKIFIFFVSVSFEVDYFSLSVRYYLFFLFKKNLFHVENTITFYSKMNVNFDFFALFLRKTISRNFILYFLGQSHHNKTLLLFTFNGWCSKCKTPKQRTKQLWMYLFFFRFCSALTNNSCLHQWNRINFSFVFILGFFVSVISCLGFMIYYSRRFDSFFLNYFSMQWSCNTDFEISPQQHNMYRRQTKTAHYYDVCHQRPDENDVENEIKSNQTKE